MDERIDEQEGLAPLERRVGNVLMLLEIKEPYEQVRFMNLEVSDVKEERRFLAGTALGGFFV